ncbi:MAG: flagellar basal body rod protein FlgB [Acidimicrobiales bacterium]
MQIGDPTFQALQASLQGLSLRRQAAEDNIANVETPGYLANRVDFEDSLRTAIDRGDPAAMDPTIARSTAPTRVNGNNVALDQEVVGLTETALRHQLVVEAMNGKFRLLRSAITGQ